MAVHDIPNTPENREKFAEAGRAHLGALGLKDGVVEVWEDGYRAARSPHDTFEWWYFDMHFDDGSTLVVTFSNKPQTAPSGPVAPQLLVIRQQPDGTSRRQVLDFPESEFGASTERCDVRIGPNTVSGDLDRYEMHIEVDGLVADLSIERGAPSWRPGAGITYFDAAEKHYLAWVVPVPYGTVTATVIEDGQAKRFEGSAYHDHNWGNKLMGSFLDHWYWGRAHVGDYTLVYVRMTTKYVFPIGQYHLPTFYLATKDRVITDELLPLRLVTSGEVDGPGHQSYPSRMEWSWETERGRISFTATDPRLIEAIDMAEERHGIRKLIHANEHPMYYDFNADLELTIDLDDLKDHATGRTLYEKMMFR